MYSVRRRSKVTLLDFDPETTPMPTRKTTVRESSDAAPRPEVASLLPLTAPAFHLLAALAEADMHGWALMKAVERATEGRIELSSGTLYGLIKRLLRQELIAESDQRPPAHWDDQRRRYYRLTELGRQVALAEMSRLEKAVEAGVALRKSGLVAAEE